jgi:hypothetical protein
MRPPKPCGLLMLSTCMLACSGGNAHSGAGYNGIDGGSGTGGGSTADNGTTGGTSVITNQGGSSALGGAAPTGGAKAIGGTTGSTTGGAKATGGVASTGGSTNAGATGGARTSGGTASTGGARTTGGIAATGGARATGGSTSGSISTGAVTTNCPGAVPTGISSSWCSCAQYGEWTNGGYTYYNDIWGSGAGAQCIWATTSNVWGVAANHPNTSGIKSYPNISVSPGKAISSINTCTSSFGVTVPSSGAYETTYDIWVKGTTSTRVEIMLWMNYTGAVAPIAASYSASGKPVVDKSNVTVGGSTWNVYFGSNGSNGVVSLVRTSNTTSGTVDIKAVLDWIIANNTTKYGVFTSSWTLDQAQFGFEITSDGTTQAFVVNNYSISSS